jgi:hypothetical protein
VTGGGWTIAVWGAINTIIVSLLFIFPRANVFSFVEAYAMALGCLLLGLVVVLLARRRRRARGPGADYDLDTRQLPDLSYATTLLGLSLFGLVLSAAFGFFLTLISAGGVLLAVGGLLRERRAMAAERRGTSDARGGSGRAEAGP